MIKVIKNKSLKSINAFKFDVRSKYYVEVSDFDDLKELSKMYDFKTEKYFILGAGYNTFFNGNFDGLILKIKIGGIKATSKRNGHVVYKVGAGEDWIDLVNKSVKKNYSGLENLTYIPGSVGAAPVQNIGAYGAELSSVLQKVSVFNLRTGGEETFSKKRCELGYRNSFFKNPKNKHFVITHVYLNLKKSKNFKLNYQSRYESLGDELKEIAKPPFSSSDVSKAILRIRKRKMPSWKTIGTAGSFFINPTVTKKQLKRILNKVPDLKYYKTIRDDEFKVPAGWLLEEIGWRGKRIGDIGTAPNQSLVLINYGKAKPQDLVDFVKRMRRAFNKAYGVNLVPEVNVVS